MWKGNERRTRPAGSQQISRSSRAGKERACVADSDETYQARFQIVFPCMDTSTTGDAHVLGDRVSIHRGRAAVRFRMVMTKGLGFVDSRMMEGKAGRLKENTG